MTRQVCERCLFTPSTCICGAIKRLKNKVSVVILQHPSEEKIAKNTAKLLNLSLTDCKTIKGENNTDFAMLNSLPLDSTVLLYPNEHATYLDDTNPKPALSNITHLIVIDGTWKKAYKILQLTPLLTKFKTVSFKQLPQNRYAIRKAPRADSLSTLEAVAHSLLLIEQLNPAPLYNLLDELIQKQTQHMPEHVKARYLN
ncbi:MULTISPECIES: tRNA-uridine aminocarboxypropyltransferase [unclassified Pseudoalteromonas]|uniref:tRNA-uridine aminocarboxypropyltransferase n=1 Tax=unclassified Pseudoalteromonas TaxID=194690 RepID=UPI00235A3DCA|nr:MULTISPECIES: tRNA-uridine aminocarboxypropyltransferase [unclassified Pseudoalteromonas]MDC9564461.1 DTW domain-containing protein [Pseudoalteromonas sp. GAB2316C]MDC9568962.1 DTW domain-containing protein [Pseudoalteromonas sp. GABNB9D]MDC9573131.1 DTW domain-containing protein [Pseudoalteromonas sp. GABNS16A]MDC9577282.1 DTW domain-containing protein [Pseudoalteromonas sp. GABNS16E]MDC9584866.1 DTW domain-containing protein [Pseudoalteromonas sp. GABNS16C]